VVAGRPAQPVHHDPGHAGRTGRDHLDDVFQVLEDEGVGKFADSWDELTESVRSELENKK
jgi:transaldolase